MGCCFPHAFCFQYIGVWNKMQENLQHGMKVQWKGQGDSFIIKLH